MLIGNKENIIFPNIHKNSTKHPISVRPTYVLNTTKKTLFKLPTTLQGCVQAHFTPTVEQPLDYKYPTPPVTVASVLKQWRHHTQQPFYLY